MTPFLKEIAENYSDRYKSLKGFCFVFPNKRCNVFFRRYLAKFGVTSDEMPHILTIAEFTSQISKRVEAPRIIQLFTLYKSYTEILKAKKGALVSFDDFRIWGDTVISDFNTVDLALADASEIFKNVKDYREITSTFLTEEQKEVMKEYFGVEDYSDTKEFWKSFSGEGKKSKARQDFLNLWQLLAPLHDKFIGSLDKEGMGSIGYIYRRAAKLLQEKGEKILPYKKIVFAGFNALTEAERKIFSLLNNLQGYEGLDDYSDFIWDLEGPVLTDSKFSAGRFVQSNLKYFPMPSWYRKKEIESARKKEIRIISAPSLTSQAKITGELLSGYKTPQGRKEIEDAEIALVLPDEGLLTNVLFSLPDDMGEINLTMGLSLRQTPVSAFMSILRRVFGSTRVGENNTYFYVKDLRILFAHPFMSLLFPEEETGALWDFIDKYHRVSVTLKDILGFIPEGEQFFTFPSKKSKAEKVFRWIGHILGLIKESIKNNEGNEDYEVIKIYEEYLQSLENAVKAYDIDTTPMSVLQMAHRLVSSEKIGFEGEPLSGLQIMGTLETRCLDFREVIILSMNEGVMPKKTYNSTFIPESLRKGYGLPPARYSEEIFAYYFYRLLHRAEKVTLVYDGRTISGLRGGVSRYILQLKEFSDLNFSISEEAWQYPLQSQETYPVSPIEKTEWIKEELKKYLSDGEGARNLSSSTLNTYRECQIRFFYQNLLRINTDPEKGDYIGSIEIGDVLHETMQDLYLEPDLQRKLLKYPVVIKEDKLKGILEDPLLIKNLVEKNIRKIYYREKKDEERKIDSGVTEIIASQICDLVKSIVEHDRTLVPFKLYGAEITRNIQVTLKSGRKVNFRFAIDRLDEIEIKGKKFLRIVDYKTGAMKKKAETLEEVFNGGYRSEQIFQLFVYSWLLGKINHKGWEEVRTEIYFVPDLIAGKSGLPVIGKGMVESFSQYKEEFSSRLEEMIEDIFTSATFNPPMKTADSNPCELCSFNTVCGK